MKVSCLIIKCLLLLVVSILLFGCGRGENNKDPETRVKGNYLKAVEKGDYEQAYRILYDYHEVYQIAQAEYQTHNISYTHQEKYKIAGKLYYKAFDYI